MARIVNHRQRPNWYSPWDMLAVQQGSGTGFVMEGGVVMTNAHVVSDTRLLLLYLHGDPTPHEATVEAIGHDCDLALVRPVVPGVLDGRAPLSLAGLPDLRSTVETYGYPAGGRQISSTRGVVSRIEVQAYSHPSNSRHLTGQTDAAINPGNSGGPVVQEGAVVGVAFQAATQLQNVGYFIPAEVVHHFWVDATSGQRGRADPYRGFPTLGARLQNLENPAARRLAGMAEGQTGAAVDLVLPGSSADGHLFPGDILLEVDGQTVANDASVVLPPSLPLSLGQTPDETLRVDVVVLVDRHQVGETIQLRVLRDKRAIDVSFPLSVWGPAARYANQHDLRPRYFVYGGLVFVPLDREMMKTFGADWGNTADKKLLQEYLLRPHEDPEQWCRERVVLLRRLDHAVNASMTAYGSIPVEKVNGCAISGLAELVAVMEANRERFHVFEFTGGRLAVLDREAADRANETILAQYAVHRDRNL